VSYLVDLQQRLARERIAAVQQQAKNVCITVTTAPVDTSSALETLVLKGPIQVVIKLANAIVAENGVRHGQLNLIPLSSPRAPGAAQ
jgi:CopG family nickel-responsive transcriptional regulator